MKIRTATYNIRAGLSDGYLKKKNYYKAAEVIALINADVIALNEVGKQLPEEIKEHAGFLAEQCGYPYYHFAKAVSFGKYPYGNAVLSRYPIDDLTVIPMKKFVHLLPGIYEPRCIVSMVLPDIRLRILCTHLGLFPDEQRMGILKVSELVGQSNIPTVFMGDMNIDSSLPIITEKMGLKMHDVCTIKNVRIPTYPAIKPRKRLDYIFVSDGIEVLNVFTVNKPASDHLPLAADLSI